MQFCKLRICKIKGIRLALYYILHLDPLEYMYAALQLQRRLLLLVSLLLLLLSPFNVIRLRLSRLWII